MRDLTGEAIVTPTADGLSPELMAGADPGPALKGNARKRAELLKNRHGFPTSGCWNVPPVCPRDLLRARRLRASH